VVRVPTRIHADLASAVLGPVVAPRVATRKRGMASTTGPGGCCATVVVGRWKAASSRSYCREGADVGDGKLWAP
jgi:hypothetical protein